MAKRAEEQFGWHSETQKRARLVVERNIEENSSGILTFDDAVAYNIGSFMPPVAWAKSRRDSDLLHQQTMAMADDLERPTELNPDPILARYDTNITRRNDVTGETSTVDTLRNVCFLPSVAKKNRRDQLNDLEYFLQENGKQYWRYAVITFGARIPAGGDLAGAITDANNRMAKWRERVLKKHGVTIGFTGLEFPRDRDGTYHLHANVLLRTPLFLDKGAGFRADTYNAFGTWWKDCGQIHNLNELVKYPFKPNSLDGADADELKWLFHSTFRRRITRIMGPIAEFRKQRKEDGLRVFRMKRKLHLRETFRVLPEENGEKSDVEVEEDPDEIDLDRQGSGGENVILGREGANFRDGLWAMPATLIMNYNPNPNPKYKKSLRRLQTLYEWQADAIALYKASGAPDPATAAHMRDAALRGPEGETNLRALWKKGGSSYIFNNETITSPENGVVIEDCEDDLDFASSDSVIQMFDPPDPPSEVPYIQIFHQT